MTICCSMAWPDWLVRVSPPRPAHTASTAVTGAWQNLSASDSGVKPHLQHGTGEIADITAQCHLSTGSGSTPHLYSRNTTHSLWPSAAARCSGVRPS